MVLEIEALETADLLEIGRHLTPAMGVHPGSGQEFSFGLVMDDLELPAPLCAGRLECASRPMVVTRMERHLRTPELLSAVDGDAVLCVAPPQEPKEGRLEGMRALKIRQGQSVLLATGAWHWIPFPAGSGAGSCQFLVVFRSGTGDEDLQIIDLAESVGMAIASESAPTNEGGQG
jgi:hypothetical protein